MYALTEKHTRRTVQLRHHDTLGAVDDERTLLRHVGNRTQIYILDSGVEVLMVGVSAVEFQLGLQRHTVSLASLKTLLDGITRRIDVVVQKLQHKVIARVGDREVLRKHFVETLVLAVLGGCVELQEVTERLQLHIQEIRERERILDRREVDARFFG